MTFHDAYHDLEDCFRALAVADGDIYLPNVEPSGPVRYVFIAMEPSLGRWAKSDAKVAREKVEAGFRNFVADEVGDVVLLHHAIRQYLGTESYHITDFSKGAMLTAHANLDRSERPLVPAAAGGAEPSRARGSDLRCLQGRCSTPEWARVPEVHRNPSL